jgi:phospholipid transport system substrate-binding protein
VIVIKELFMNKIIALMLALLLACNILVAHAEIMAPDELITVTVRDVLELINKDRRSNDANNKKILEFIDARILPHFDFERLTKLAVGRPWRTATARSGSRTTARSSTGRSR